jgi:hypothetical protein
MAWTGVILNGVPGVSFQNDLKVALRRSVNSKIQLVGDVDANGNHYGAINVMAKYKPFRNSLAKFADFNARNTARALARYGMASPPTFVASSVYPPVWSYAKPYGYTPLREADFIKDMVSTGAGYDPNAVAPLSVSVGQLVFDAESQILLWGNAHIAGWYADRSLAIGELLSSTEYSSYIAIILYDAAKGEVNLIRTSTTWRAFVESSYGMKAILLQGYDYGTSQRPGVPILRSANSGDTIEVFVCLSTGGPASGEYDVLTTNLNLQTMVSVAFVSGCDRTSATLTSGAFSMDGTVIQTNGILVTATDTAIEETESGLTWRAYSLEIRALISTTGAAAYTGTKDITGSINMSTSGKFGEHATSAVSPFSGGVSAQNLASRTADQNKFIWSSGGTNYLWLPKVNGSVVRTSVTIDLDFDYPFTAGHHATGTTTIYIP